MVESERYPEQGTTFLSQVEQRNQRFAALREDFLLNYGYNTARAYWGDLEDIKDWAEGRGFDVLGITDTQFAQYVARMKRRRYSMNTIRRRRGTWNLFTSSYKGQSPHRGRPYPPN